MAQNRFASKVVYYGGYPGSSGKPVRGTLHWRDGTLQFQPSGGEGTALQIEGARLRAVRRSEEGMTGARRVRLLVEVEVETDKPHATLKFEIGTLLLKERKLQHWLDVLAEACKERKGNNG